MIGGVDGELVGQRLVPDADVVEAGGLGIALEGAAAPLRQRRLELPGLGELVARLQLAVHREHRLDGLGREAHRGDGVRRRLLDEETLERLLRGGLGRHAVVLVVPLVVARSGVGLPRARGGGDAHPRVDAAAGQLQVHRLLAVAVDVPGHLLLLLLVPLLALADLHVFVLVADAVAQAGAEVVDRHLDHVVGPLGQVHEPHHVPGPQRVLDAVAHQAQVGARDRARVRDHTHRHRVAEEDHVRGAIAGQGDAGLADAELRRSAGG